jgi:CRP-like cAMP-binding protein
VTANFNGLLIDERHTLTASRAAHNELLGQLLNIPGITASLLPQLRIVPLTVNQVLYEQGDKIGEVYFPLDSVVSGLAIMEDGTTIETAMVGREGLVGISTVLGSGLSRQWIWTTIGGSAMKLDARVLDNLFVQNENALRALLQCYRSLVTQVSQRCVCNTRHTILERLCCWLLMIHDRVGGHKLSLTQEMIASRVGARRAGITVAAGMLQEMGAIEYRRGQLYITNPEILRRAVCECYAFLKAEVNNSPARGYSTFSL